MLVKELKDVISKYSKEEKDKIIIELYKRIPKSKKEDYDKENYKLVLPKKISNIVLNYYMLNLIHIVII